MELLDTLLNANKEIEMKIKLLLIIIFLQGCAGTRVGLFRDFKDTTAGAQEVFRLDVPLYKKGNVECLYTHESKLLSGRPFNDKKEGTHDMLGCMWEIK